MRMQRTRALLLRSISLLAALLYRRKNKFGLRPGLTDARKKLS